MTYVTFFQIAALIVLSAIAYGYMTYLITKYFFQKCNEMQNNIMFPGLAEETEPFDPTEGFATSPVGIPPSLGRE